ncbi:MAG TPA: D-erythronate dehydrogenase [Lacunisphaera sp.]|nr:D-erythronate dehydrogenase [Lacunisphaera sp.]
MKILITGGAGFLGQRVARRLLAEYPDSTTTLVLADYVATDAFAGEPRVHAVACDISDRAALARLLTPDTAVVYHLAAIVSGQAEAEFDLGLRVNLAATEVLLELCRRLPAPPKFVFASSLAVFGGVPADAVSEQTAVCPQSSYGTQKAIGELLVNDYSRKGFIDGRALRLPTIAVRPGKPNRAASSFVSGIIREPLHGLPAACPVGRDVLVAISSPNTAVENLVYAHRLPAAAWGASRTLILPGLSVTIGEMLDTLARVAGAEVAARVRFERDEAVERIVLTWPARLDCTRARSLGFQVDRDFESILRGYQRDAGR